MPKAPAKKQPVVAPTPPPAPVATPQAEAWPIRYPTLTVEEFSTTSAKGPLDIEWQKAAMGWETESEFVARKLAENPGSKPEQWMVNPQKKDTFGDQYHCRDISGQKVRCNYNAHNRPFDEGWSEDITHMVLHGNWAGPHTLPGETVNGETIRISRYGWVLSGQHCMTGCVRADEKLQKARAELGREAADKKYPTWAGHDHCFLETIVVKGMSEDPRVLMTVDYVKPRTAADVFYTSDTFKTRTSPERKELCRMLATATDLLWTRTAAQGYRTHPEQVAFLDRHKKLLDCVLHLFDENSATRRISKMRLSAGGSAAIMYLMGCGATDAEYSDVYRNQEPPTEKGLDWSLWDKADEFWTILASGLDFEPVRLALGKLVDSTPGNDENQGLGGRGPEKMAILARAWEIWKEHPPSGGKPFTKDDPALVLSYNNVDDEGVKLPNGQIKLLDVADFLGIDCPEVVAKGSAKRGGTSEPPPPTGAEYERLQEEARARRATATR